MMKAVLVLVATILPHQAFAQLTITVGGNNGAAYCSAYCAYNWNGQVTAAQPSWKGACCSKAINANTGDEVSCTSMGSGAGTKCECQQQDSTPFFTGAGSSNSFSNTNNVCAPPTPAPTAAPTPAPTPPPAPGPTPAPSISEGSNKKITMVISTLKDILQSVVNEEKEERTMYDKYMSWCRTERGSLSKDLIDTNTELANSKVLLQEQISTVDSLTLTISKNEKEMEETKDGIAQAVALRTEENEKYTEEMQLNTQSLRQIDKAIEHVGKVNKQGGFLQNGVLKKLALNQPGESSYVLGVMKGLKDKLSKTKTQLVKMETEKVSMHDSFMQTKGQSLKMLSDSTTGKKIELTEASAKQTSTQQKISKLTEESAALTISVGKTGETCDSTAQELFVREGDRTKEKAALNEAVRYLTETSLEQLSLVQKSSEDKNDEEHASVVFAPAFVQTAAENSKYTDNAFFAAANAELSGEGDDIENHMKKSTFDGVKTVVDKLISSHQDTQKEETNKKDYCEKELEAKDDEKAQTTTDLEAVKANIAKKQSEVETLVEEVKNLYTSIDDIKKSLDDATTIRKEEAGLYAASSKDRNLAIKVLTQAKAVLQNFYNQGQSNLMQTGQEAPPLPSSSRKTTASFGAVSMVQDITDDITKEQTDATKDEQDAKTTYGKLQKESRTKTDEKHADVTQRVMAKAKLGVQINTLKETQTQKTEDLTAINKQLGALHEQCDELTQFYDKRVKARTFEVAQLRDVMDILSGSSISARTGLVEEDESDSQ